MSVDQFIVDAFEQWLVATVTPAAVRAVERGEGAGELWGAVQESGFADLVVPEDKEGAGASPETLYRVISACGAHAVPLPLPQTIFIRAALAADGLTLPHGALALATGRRSDGGIVCRNVACGAVADWVLADLEDKAVLLPATVARRNFPGIHGSLLADFTWPALPPGAVVLPTRRPWRIIGAMIFAALMAGAADSVLRLTLQYAGERKQFGRPIAAFQAVQQQISVQAEQVFALRMAAQLAFRRDVLSPSPLLAAVAKARAGEAVGDITAIGHMVHGAIGVTGEYDLQLYTRRLHEWRSQFGGETQWNKIVGESAFAHGGTTLDFLLAVTGP